MKLALSTSWFKVKECSPSQMVAKLKELSVSLIEVDYRLTEDYLKELKKLVQKDSLQTTSVHNYLPWPSISSQPGGDIFSLASQDRQEWEYAVRFTIKTLEEAAELAARAVVLHLGAVELKEGSEFYSSLREKDVIPTIPEELLKKRDELSFPYLDRVKLALDKILKFAERFELNIGIENRYHFYEIPSFNEVKILLADFAGTMLVMLKLVESLACPGAANF